MRLVALALLLALAGGVQAQAPVQPQGEPVVEQAPRDPDFGVTAHGFGLQRQVEMLQWRHAGFGYRKEWSEQPIDSTGFAPAHRNPAYFPFETRYWIAASVVLDGRPVDEDVLKEYGRWRDFRPGFRALPPRLAVSFQPEGDGLGTADNPLDPQVGDLRVHWRVLELPPLAGKVALQGGVWIPASDAVAAGADAVGTAPETARWRWTFVALALLAGAAWWWRRRR